MQARQQPGLLSSKGTLILAASAVAILGLYGLWNLNSQNSQEVRSEELQQEYRREGEGIKKHVNDVKAYLRGLRASWLHAIGS